MDPVAGSTRWFEQEMELAAPRDAVWAAIAEAAGVQQWFAPEAKVADRVGGEVVWRWTDFFHWPQTIEVREPGKRLLTRYDSTVDDGRGGKRPLFVDFTLEGEGGRTTLRLVHSGFGDEAGFDAEFDGIRGGWPVELESLRLWLERHRGEERTLAWGRRAVAEDPGAAWAKLAGPEGLAFGALFDGLARGDRFDWTTPDGDRFHGRVLLVKPTETIGRAESHGDGFLRVWTGECGGASHVWVWLATWGRPPAEARRLQERWDARLQRLFPHEQAVTGQERS